MATLWDVIDHYNKGGVPNPFLDGGMQRLGAHRAGDRRPRRVPRHAHQRPASRRSRKKEMAKPGVAQGRSGRSATTRRPWARRGTSATSRPDLKPPRIPRTWACTERCRAGSVRRHRTRPMRQRVITKSIETKYIEERDALFARLRRLSTARLPQGRAASRRASRPPRGCSRPTRSSSSTSRRRRRDEAGVLASRTSRTRTSTSATLNDRFVRAILKRGRRRERARPAAGLRPLRRRPRAARPEGGARPRRADPEGPEGAGPDDGRRARLVPRHGRALAGALRARRTYSFDHKGVHFVTLMSVSREGLLDGAQHDARCSACRRSRASTTRCSRGSRSATRVAGGSRTTWRRSSPKTPLVVFSHSPLYKYYRNWNFWTEDADEIQAILGRFKNGDGDPRAHAPAPLQPHRQHQLPRDAVDRVALAVRAVGPPRASPCR